MSYQHSASSIHATHPLRRGSGLLFVIALHLAVIVAINNGTQITGVIASVTPVNLLPVTDMPKPPPIPVNPTKPVMPMTTTFTLPIPSDPVVESVPSATDTSTTTESRGESHEGQFASSIVSARVDPSRPLTQPAYPTASRRNSEQGRVELMLYILANGKVADAKIAQSSGYSRLDESAVREALRSWKFIPQQENGVATPSWQRFAITFRLDN
ncbi:MAG: energy transducer TonB [Spongiibacteraceae bacterium]